MIHEICEFQIKIYCIYIFTSNSKCDQSGIILRINEKY